MLTVILAIGIVSGYPAGSFVAEIACVMVPACNPSDTESSIARTVIVWGVVFAKDSVTLLEKLTPSRLI